MASMLQISCRPTCLTRAVARSTARKLAFKSFARPNAAHVACAVRQPTTAKVSPAATQPAAAPTVMTTKLEASGPFALMALAIACSMAMPEHATAHMEVVSVASNPQFDLAEGQEFWGNVARYGRYFVTVMLGTGYVMLRPLANAFKNPLSAILAIGAVAGGSYFVKYTLEAMLGIGSDPLPFEYVQGQF